MVEVLVLIDFNGQLDDELTLKTGDVVRNVKKGAEDGWMEGELAGRRGVFPSQFVKEIPASLMGDGKAKYPRSIRKVKAKAPQRWCKAEYSYTPEKGDELELTAGEIVEVIQEIEDGWWLGKKGDKVGAFPSNFVQDCPAPIADVVSEVAKNNKQRQRVGEATFHPNGPDKSTSQGNTSPKNNHKVVAKEYCKVMFDYTASNRDELSMKGGDVILVLRKETEDDGWWEGELNGNTGLFPDNFVMLLPTVSQAGTDKPPTRKLTLKVPAKNDMTVPEKKPADVLKLPAQALKDQRAKNDMTVPEKKPVDVLKLPSQALKDQRANKTDTVAEKKVAEVSKPQPPKDQKDWKESSKITHAPLKKVAPSPPAPVKNKPAFKANDRPDGNFQAKPAEPVKEKPAETDASQFDDLTVSSSKLSHPTSDRPKMPGKRPPTNLNHAAAKTEENSILQDTKVEEMEEKPKPKALIKEKETEVPAPLPAPAPAPSPTPAKSPTPSNSSPPRGTTAGSPNKSQTKKTQLAKTSPVSAVTEAKKKDDSGDKQTVAELKSDIQSLKVLMEMIKAQYERDMLSVKAELKQERAERLALQVEMEKLKKLVSS